VRQVVEVEKKRKKGRHGGGGAPRTAAAAALKRRWRLAAVTLSTQIRDIPSPRLCKARSLPGALPGGGM